MLESFVISLREGIEAALAVGIVLVYLRRAGRTDLVPAVYQGLAAALVASVAAAFFLEQQELTEGLLMIGAAVLLVTMVVWMGRQARGLRGEIERRVGGLAAGRGRLGASAGLFALTFLLVFREGVETVLLVAAVNLTSDALLAFAGGLAGLVLAVLFGVAFVNGSVRIDLGRFFRVTGIVLLIFAAQLLVGGVHELAESGVIRLGRSEMQVIGPIVKAQALFLAALLAIPLLFVLVPGRDAARAAKAAPRGPERRQLLAGARRESRWRTAAGSAGIAIVVALTASYAYSRVPRAIDPPRLLEPAEAIRLPVAGLDDGRLHRFGVPLDGTVVRFFVIRSAPGKIATAFDACEICGTAGYLEEHGHLTCLTCAADIVPATVGIGGGCNPIPLPHQIEGGDLVIALADLRAQVALFGKASGAP